MAAVGINVSLDFSAFAAALDALGPKHFNAAAMIGLNATAKQANAKAVRRVAKAGGFKVADVKKRIITVRATTATLRAVITASGKALPLILFNARQQKRGVSASAWGKRKLYRGAFIAKMKTGHRGVFRRLGDERLPIEELWGPGIARTMASPEVRADIEMLIRERLPINLVREFDRRMRVLSGKANLSAKARRKIR